ncbi:MULTISPECIES: GGDEF domain-containing protein [Cupriavidus]|uniref:diguanylate cyclase n=1 Tax=Cupriavidus pauculus TaxID=82633 RepID=A0A5P2H1I8_9BURK|nr:GGDEF domain-containing protein [Cupriavidus pauculus]QET01200.1 GGDEF domain-containing protein [Cupriavidus pauculus]
MFQSQVVVLIAGLFALQMAVVCAVLRRSPGMDRSGLSSWAAGDLIVALAVVLLAAHTMRPALPLEAVPELVLTAGLSMMVYGMRHFVGRPGRGLVLLALNVPGLAARGAHALEHGFTPAAHGIAVLNATAEPAVASLTLAASVVQILLLLELVRITVPCVPMKRGTGRLAALSLVLVALACTALIGMLIAPAVVMLVDLRHLPALAQSAPHDGILVLLVFGMVGLSVSFALMAHDRLRRMLERRARHDDLTDVLSRGAFWEELEAACRKAERAQQPLTVAFIDLDHFKAINDVYGHLAGDSVLRHFAGLLRRNAPPGAIVGRLGGEEFAVVMPATTMEAGRAASLRLNTLVRATPCPSEPDPISYTVSIGMAERQPGENADAVMRRADRALYDAKLMGRNCVSSHDSGDAPGMPRRPRVREDERSAPDGAGKPQPSARP